MRRYLIAGNWKMNKTNNEAIDLARRIVLNTKGIEKIDIVICPPFTALAPVYDAIKDSNVRPGAQNMYYEDEGAYTGEISGKFLKAMGCEFVIIGHSERRKYFSESDTDVNKKIKKALSFGITPIVCVGETLEEREKGKTADVVKKEIIGALQEQTDKEKIIFAYEPIWAIGTGKTAQPEDANKIHNLIRNIIKTDFGMDETVVRVLYGGSVNPSNAEALMSQPDIDGSLVGGASLDVKSFVEIITTSANLA
ncbi:MAG: triose-phosphate isomerase [Candidatus Cloacimonadota bacterium]|nr:MAG: triose-phosphate isomerase [Candidatus Cloacimonadota bacterium]